MEFIKCDKCGVLVDKNHPANGWYIVEVESEQTIWHVCEKCFQELVGWFSELQKFRGKEPF